MKKRKKFIFIFIQIHFHFPLTVFSAAFVLTSIFISHSINREHVPGIK